MEAINVLLFTMELNIHGSGYPVAKFENDLFEFIDDYITVKLIFE